MTPLNNQVAAEPEAAATDLDSEEAMAKFDLEFTSEMADALPSAMYSQVRNEAGSYHVQAYLARDGEHRPDFDSSLRPSD